VDLILLRQASGYNYIGHRQGCERRAAFDNCPLELATSRYWRNIAILLTTGARGPDGRISQYAREPVVLPTVGSGAFANPSPLPETESFVHLFPRIENRDTWGTRPVSNSNLAARRYFGETPPYEYSPSPLFDTDNSQPRSRRVQEAQQPS
jgi:hypothetical protein